MEIPSISYVFNWYEKEFKERSEEHIGPACIMLATTVIIAKVWGKHSAFGFICLELVTYPFHHRQIVYLMYLEAHETAYAVAVVGIQVFCMKFPLLSHVGLPMSVALGCSYVMRGMEIRRYQKELQAEISRLNQLNGELREKVTSLSENCSQLKGSLEILADQVLKKKELVVQVQEAHKRKEDVTIEIDTDFSELVTTITELNTVCQNYIKEKSIQEQLNKMDTNAIEIAKQAALIRTQSAALESILAGLKEANQKFQDLVDRAEKNEGEVQTELQRFREWVLNLNLAMHPVH